MTKNVIKCCDRLCHDRLQIYTTWNKMGELQKVLRKASRPGARRGRNRYRCSLDVRINSCCKCGCSSLGVVWLRENGIQGFFKCVFYEHLMPPWFLPAG